MRPACRTLCLALLFAAGSALAQAATAPGDGLLDPGPHARSSELSVLLYLPWYYGVGVGLTARFAFPLLREGLLPGVNDSIELEPGLAHEAAAYRIFGNSYPYSLLSPFVIGTWSLHLTKAMRGYLGLSVGWAVGLHDSSGGTYTAAGFSWDLLAGFEDRFSDHLALRAELGYHGPKVGLAWVF